MQGPRVEIVVTDSGEDEDGEDLAPTGAVDVYDEESVARAMEAALSQFQNLGVTEDDCDHHATPGGAAAADTTPVDFVPTVKRRTSDTNICRIISR